MKTTIIIAVGVILLLALFNFKKIKMAFLKIINKKKVSQNFTTQDIVLKTVHYKKGEPVNFRGFEEKEFKKSIVEHSGSNEGLKVKFTSVPSKIDIVNGRGLQSQEKIVLNKEYSNLLFYNKKNDDTSGDFTERIGFVLIDNDGNESNESHIIMKFIEDTTENKVFHIDETKDIEISYDSSSEEYKSKALTKEWFEDNLDYNYEGEVKTVVFDSFSSKGILYNDYLYQPVSELGNNDGLENIRISYCINRKNDNKQVGDFTESFSYHLEDNLGNKSNICTVTINAIDEAQPIPEGLSISEVKKDDCNTGKDKDSQCIQGSSVEFNVTNDGSRRTLYIDSLYKILSEGKEFSSESDDSQSDNRRYSSGIGQIVIESLDSSNIFDGNTKNRVEFQERFTDDLDTSVGQLDIDFKGTKTLKLTMESMNTAKNIETDLLYYLDCGVSGVDSRTHKVHQDGWVKVYNDLEAVSINLCTIKYYRD